MRNFSKFHEMSLRLTGFQMMNFGSPIKLKQFNKTSFVLLNPELYNAVKPFWFLCFDTSNGGGDLFSSFVWYYRGRQLPTVENNYFKLKAYIINATIVKKIQVCLNFDESNLTESSDGRGNWALSQANNSCSVSPLTLIWKQHSHDVIIWTRHIMIWRFLVESNFIWYQSRIDYSGLY